MIITAGAAERLLKRARVRKLIGRLRRRPRKKS